jgi:hypothetical protein
MQALLQPFEQESAVLGACLNVYLGAAPASKATAGA